MVSVVLPPFLPSSIVFLKYKLPLGFIFLCFIVPKHLSQSYLNTLLMLFYYKCHHKCMIFGSSQMHRSYFQNIWFITSYYGRYFCEIKTIVITKRATKIFYHLLLLTMYQEKWSFKSHLFMYYFYPSFFFQCGPSAHF